MWQFTIIGCVGAKPELRYTPDGDVFTVLRIAANRAYRDRVGEKKIVTSWARITLFGKQAANAGKYLDKGARVFVQGQIESERWKDKAGVKRYGESYIGETVQYLSAMGKSSMQNEHLPEAADASWSKRNTTAR